MSPSKSDTALLPIVQQSCVLRTASIKASYNANIVELECPCTVIGKPCDSSPTLSS
jgi:hypothetical protein